MDDYTWQAMPQQQNQAYDHKYMEFYWGSRGVGGRMLYNGEGGTDTFTQMQSDGFFDHNEVKGFILRNRASDDGTVWIDCIGTASATMGSMLLEFDGTNVKKKGHELTGA